MTLMIPYESEDFSYPYNIPSGTLSTSWDDLIWAALTVGRPPSVPVLRYGVASFYEAIFRMSLIGMAIEQDNTGRLRRTRAFAVLDPTEKGAVNYFLGMAICKLFASKLLNTSYILHLDVHRDLHRLELQGRSRPDLYGTNDFVDWHAFECKGRSRKPSDDVKQNAKSQAHRLISVDGNQCRLHVGSFAYFKNDVLNFYWRDPEPDNLKPIELPFPVQEWRYYYEPAISLTSEEDGSPLFQGGRPPYVSVGVHPAVHQNLRERRWLEALKVARENLRVFKQEGYQPDGLMVKADEWWEQPFHSRELE